MTSPTAPHPNFSEVNLGERPCAVAYQMASFAFPAATFGALAHAAGITTVHALLRVHPSMAAADQFLDAAPISTLVAAALGLLTAAVLPTAAYTVASARAIIAAPNLNVLADPAAQKDLQQRTSAIRAANRVAQEVVWVLGPSCGPAIARALFDLPEGMEMLGAKEMLVSALVVRVTWWMLVGVRKLVARISGAKSGDIQL